MGSIPEPQAGSDAGSLTITLVSTRTRDRRPLAGGKTCDSPGGPATFVTTALRRLGHPVTVLTGETVDVEVVPRADGQEYVIPAIKCIPLPPHLDGNAVILSPIMQEIIPSAVPPTDGLLSLDLQGFVREPLRPTDSSSRHYDLETLLRRAMVVKGAEDEIHRLTPASRRALEGSILLLTRGRNGADIFVRGLKHHVAAEVVPTSNTIGAGDTFLAAYVSWLLRTEDPVQAGVAAARFTESVLRQRQEAEDARPP